MTSILYDPAKVHLPDANEYFPVTDPTVYVRTVREQHTPCLQYRVGNGANKSGGWNLDSEFLWHDATARKNDLRRRGYWFAPFNIDQFLRVFPPADDADPILDFETNSTPLTAHAADSAVLRLEAEWGRLPDFYGGETWRVHGAPGTNVARCPYWGPSYIGHLDVPVGVGKPVQFQYSASGRGPSPHSFPGVQPGCDMNILLVPYDELIRKPPPPPPPKGDDLDMTADQLAQELGYATVRDQRVQEMRSKAVADVLAGRTKRTGQDAAYNDQYDKSKAKLG